MTTQPQYPSAGLRLGGIVVSLVLGAWACGGQEIDEEENLDGLDTVQSPINGTVNVGPNCTALEGVKVRDAMAVLVNAITPPAATNAFLACLKDGILSEPKGQTAEDVLTRFRANLPTNIDCLPSVCGDGGTAIGCGGIGIPEERLTLQKAYINSATATQLAGVIAHEIAHNKGWDHQDGAIDYGYRVTNQVNRCIASGAPSGLRRSAAPGATELAPSGGSGGNPFERHCLGEQFLQGGSARRTSTALNQFTPWCELSSLTPVGEVKDATDTTPARCPPNTVVVGITGRASATVVGFNFLCASRTAVSNGTVNPPTSTVAMGVWAGGTEFSRMCPTGMAVKHLYGQSGARIDQLRLGCETVAGLRRGERTLLPVAGTQTGPSQLSNCLGHGAMVGLYGNVLENGAVVSLGSLCRPTKPSGPFGYPAIGTEEHIADRMGGWGGDSSFLDRCPTGQLMVGYTFYGTAQIDSVRARCALPSEWSNPTGTATIALTPVRGHAVGILRERGCPRGKYVVGFQAWATPANGQVLRAMVPICQKLDVPPVLAPN